MYAPKALPAHHREGFHLPFPLYRERCRTEEAFPSLRFRSLSQLVIPRQPGKYRLRMASGHFYLSMNHPAGFYPVPQDHQHTLILDGEFIFGACTSIVYRASLIK